METLNSDTPMVSNQEVSRVLFHVASILELTQESMYRVRAYRRAALGVLMLPRPLVDYVLTGQDMPLPGVGKRIKGRLHELVNTGQMGVYASLLEELGEPFVALLSLHGIGPKTAMRLVNELEIGSLADLADAARHGRIRQLRGFGPVLEAKFGAQAEALLDQAA